MTDISWTDESWNPIVGCSIASKGCRNCYAMRMAWRQEHGFKTHHYSGTTKKVNGNPVWTGRVAMAPKRILMKPLKRKKPTMYFVNSMSDLFHEDIPWSWVDKCFEVMEQCGLRDNPHTFQILTKRSKRQKEYMIANYSGINPPDNIWLGVSAEDQKRADERIPDLIDTPATTRFLSLEPQLEMIDLRDYFSWVGSPSSISWIIQGCESGPGARDFHLPWARIIRDQCVAMSVPYFLKQTIDANGNLDRSQILDGVKHDAMPEVRGWRN